MENSLISQGTEIIKQAVVCDNNNDLDQALSLYRQGLEYFMTGLKYVNEDDPAKEVIREKMNSYITRAEQIKEALDQYGAASSATTSKSMIDDSSSSSLNGKEKKEGDDEEEADPATAELPATLNGSSNSISEYVHALQAGNLTKQELYSSLTSMYKGGSGPFIPSNNEVQTPPEANQLQLMEESVSHIAVMDDPFNPLSPSSSASQHHHQFYQSNSPLSEENQQLPVGDRTIPEEDPSGSPSSMQPEFSPNSPSASFSSALVSPASGIASSPISPSQSSPTSPIPDPAAGAALSSSYHAFKARERARLEREQQQRSSVAHPQETVAADATLNGEPVLMTPVKTMFYSSSLQDPSVGNSGDKLQVSSATASSLQVEPAAATIVDSQSSSTASATTTTPNETKRLPASSRISIPSSIPTTTTTTTPAPTSSLKSSSTTRLTRPTSASEQRRAQISARKLELVKEPGAPDVDPATAVLSPAPFLRSKAHRDAAAAAAAASGGVVAPDSAAATGPTTPKRILKTTRKAGVTEQPSSAASTTTGRLSNAGSASATPRPRSATTASSFGSAGRNLMPSSGAGSAVTAPPARHRLVRKLIPSGNLVSGEKPPSRRASLTPSNASSTTAAAAASSSTAFTSTATSSSSTAATTPEAPRRSTFSAIKSAARAAARANHQPIETRFEVLEPKGEPPTRHQDRDDQDELKEDSTSTALIPHSSSNSSDQPTPSIIAPRPSQVSATVASRHPSSHSLIPSHLHLSNLPYSSSKKVPLSLMAKTGAATECASCHSLHLRCDKLSVELARAQEHLTGMHQHHSQLESVVREKTRLTNENEVLQQRLAKSESRALHMSNQLTLIRLEHEKHLRQELIAHEDVKRQELDQATSKYDHLLQNELEAAQARVEEVQLEKKGLITRLGSLSTQKRALEKTLSSLESSYKTLQEAYEVRELELKRGNGKLNTEDETDSMKEEALALQAELAAKEKQLQLMMNEKEAMRKELGRLKKEYELLQQKQNNHKGDYQELYQTTQDRLKQQESYVKDLQSQLEQARQEVEDEKDLVRQLQSAASVASSNGASRPVAQDPTTSPIFVFERSQKEKALRRVEDLQGQVLQLQTQVQTLQAEAASSSATATAGRIVDLDSTTASSAFDFERRQKESALKKVEALQAQLAHLQAQVHTLQSEDSSASEAAALSAKMIQQLQHEKDDLAAELVTVKRELQLSKSSAATVAASSSNLHDESTSQLWHRLDEAQVEIQSLRDQILQLQTLKDEMFEENQLLRKQLQLKEREHQALLARANSNTSTSMDEAVRDENKQLRHQLQFLEQEHQAFVASTNAATAAALASATSPSPRSSSAGRRHHSNAPSASDVTNSHDLQLAQRRLQEQQEQNEIQAANAAAAVALREEENTALKRQLEALAKEKAAVEKDLLRAKNTPSATATSGITGEHKKSASSTSIRSQNIESEEKEDGNSTREPDDWIELPIEDEQGRPTDEVIGSTAQTRTPSRTLSGSKSATPIAKRTNPIITSASKNVPSKSVVTPIKSSSIKKSTTPKAATRSSLGQSTPASASSVIETPSPRPRQSVNTPIPHPHPSTKNKMKAETPAQQQPTQLEPKQQETKPQPVEPKTTHAPSSSLTKAGPIANVPSPLVPNVLIPTATSVPASATFSAAPTPRTSASGVFTRTSSTASSAAGRSSSATPPPLPHPQTPTEATMSAPTTPPLFDLHSSVFLAPASSIKFPSTTSLENDQSKLQHSLDYFKVHYPDNAETQRQVLLIEGLLQQVSILLAKLEDKQVGLNHASKHGVEQKVLERSKAELRVIGNTLELTKENIRHHWQQLLASVGQTPNEFASLTSGNSSRRVWTPTIPTIGALKTSTIQSQSTSHPQPPVSSTPTAAINSSSSNSKSLFSIPPSSAASFQSSAPISTNAETTPLPFARVFHTTSKESTTTTSVTTSTMDSSLPATAPPPTSTAQPRFAPWNSDYTLPTTNLMNGPMATNAPTTSSSDGHSDTKEGSSALLSTTSSTTTKQPQLVASPFAPSVPSSFFSSPPPPSFKSTPALKFNVLTSPQSQQPQQPQSSNQPSTAETPTSSFASTLNAATLNGSTVAPSTSTSAVPSPYFTQTPSIGSTIKRNLNLFGGNHSLLNHSPLLTDTKITTTALSSPTANYSFSAPVGNNTTDGHGTPGPVTAMVSTSGVTVGALSSIPFSGGSTFNLSVSKDAKNIYITHSSLPPSNSNMNNRVTTTTPSIITIPTPPHSQQQRPSLLDPSIASPLALKSSSLFASPNVDRFSLLNTSFVGQGNRVAPAPPPSATATTSTSLLTATPFFLSTDPINSSLITPTSSSFSLRS